MSGLVKDGFYKQVDHKVGDDKYTLLSAGGHKEWSTSSSANTLVARDANKDIFARLFNTSESEMGTTTPFSRVYVSNDGNIRWKSKANFAHELRDSGELDSRWVLKSGDIMTGDLKMDGTKNLSHGSWDHGIIAGADGHDKVVLTYLASSTNGATIGAHNSNLSAWALLNISGTQLVFRNNEAERMRLDSSGNLGINTTTPTEKLDVNGYIYATGYKKSNSSDSYVLLGGGGHKLLTELFTFFGDSSNNQTKITIGGTTYEHQINAYKTLVTQKYDDTAYPLVFTHANDSSESSFLYKNYSNLLYNPSKHSLAQGATVTASGYCSHAEGELTTASGDRSHAEGNQSTASKYCSHAEGDKTTASNNCAHSEGSETTASGGCSHAEGYKTTASGDYAHAEGELTQAKGSRSHTSGYDTIANNYCESAFGKYNTSNSDTLFSVGIGTTNNNRINGFEVTVDGKVKAHDGFYKNNSNNTYLLLGGGGHALISNLSVANANKIKTIFTENGGNHYLTFVDSNNKPDPDYENLYTNEGIFFNPRICSFGHGYQVTASGNYSHAEGYKTQAIGYDSHAEGSQTIASGDYSHAEGDQAQAQGDHSHAEGKLSISYGTHSHAEGESTQAIGGHSHTEGKNTQAQKANSHAEGYGTVAGGEKSHAEGEGSEALGEHAHAESFYTKAYGAASHAEGYKTQAGIQGGNTLSAEGHCSHAEGEETKATGSNSHAEGYFSEASGRYAHAENYYTYATGWYSHAQGHHAYATANQSFAGGYYTRADHENEVAFGKYNQSNSDTIFSIGGGSSGSRYNLFEVTTDGILKVRSSAYLCINSGSVGIGTTSPSYKLHVNGDSYASGYSRAGGFYHNSYGSANYFLTSDGGARYWPDLYDGRYFRYEGWWSSGSGQNVNNAEGMTFVYSDHGSPSGWGILSTFSYQRGSSYKMQLFSNGYTDGYTYYRNQSSDRGGWGSWIRLLDSTNYTEYVNNYYWANVKVSTSSSTSTTPQFGTVGIGTNARTDALLTLPANQVQINFRPDHGSYNAKIEYMTSGNEALVFGTQNSVTSFIFANGLNLTNRSDYQNLGNVSLQIKSNKVSIGAPVRGDSDSQTESLYVNGNTRINGTLDILSEARLKIWNVTSTRNSGFGAEMVFLQTSIDSADPASSWPDTNRNDLFIQPYGGHITFGPRRTHHDYRVWVEGSSHFNGVIEIHPNANLSTNSDYTYPGGAYYSTGAPNIRLYGDNNYGLSTIEFISQKGSTSINKPSDCGFIQFQPYGYSSLANVGSYPGLSSSGESNKLIIGVNNDSDDMVCLQTPSTTGLKHIVGTSSYTIWDSGNDGSGSGLDADAVDGVHADGFMRKYGTNVAQTYSSINSIIYGESTVDGNPAGTNASSWADWNTTLLTLGSVSNRTKQLIFNYSKDDIYYRRYTDSGWSSMRTIAFTDSIFEYANSLNGGDRQITNLDTGGTRNTIYWHSENVTGNPSNVFGNLFNFSNKQNPSPGTNDHWIQQLDFTHDNKIWHRQRINTNSWTAWEQLITSNNIGSMLVPIGTIVMWYSTTVPDGWLLCNGGSISSSEYPELYNILGGKLPDFTGYVPVGIGTRIVNGVTKTFSKGAPNGGEYSHRLTTDEMPSHSHSINIKDYYGVEAGWSRPISGQDYVGEGYQGLEGTDTDNSHLAYYNHSQTTNTTGSGNSHNNIQPSAGVYFIIKARHSSLASGSGGSVNTGNGVAQSHNTTTGNLYPMGSNYASNGSRNTLYTRGEFYFNNGGAYHTSDIKKKYDIKEISNEDTTKLFENETGLVKHYRWKDTNKPSYGFIAQEIQEYCPEAVDYNEDTGLYSVNYDVALSKMVGVMFKKIKELENKLKENGIS